MEIITITDSAKKHLIEICETQACSAVRFGVKGGGCSGFTYDWECTDKTSTNELDELIELGDKALIIDYESLMFIIGAQIDYSKEIWGSALTVTNPNIGSQCGCGESFYMP
tara:strand:- start:128 stop:460 length:333 start_codon:yes stop_codon:yes gene_type:complete